MLTSPITTGFVQLLYLHATDRSLARRALKESFVRVSVDDLKTLVARYERALRDVQEAEARQRRVEEEEAKRQAEEERRRKEELERSQEPILPPVLRTVGLAGEVGPQSAVVTARVELAVGENATRVIRLMPLPGALAASRLPDPEDRIEVEEENNSRTVLYTPARRGTMTVELDIVVPLVSDRSHRSLSIDLPGAANQTLSLKIPGPASGLAVSPDWIPAAVSPLPTGGAKLDAVVGGAGAIKLAWMAHAAPVSKRPSLAPTAAPAASPRLPVQKGPRLFVNVATLYSVGDKIVRFHTWIDLANSRDRVGAVEFYLPMEVQVRQVSGPLFKTYETSPQGHTRVVRVHFTEMFRGKTRLEMNGEVGLSSSASDSTTNALLPLLSVPGAVRVNGVVGVSAFTTCRIQPDATMCQDVSRIEVSDLPDEVTGGSPSPILLAFRLASSSSKLVLTLSRFNPHRRLTAAVEGVNAVTVLSPTQVRSADGTATPRLRTYNRLVMKVVNAGDQDLKFRLPQGAHIESCFVDLVPRKPAREPTRDGWTTYRIPLKLSVVCNGRLVPFPLEISFRHDAPWQERWWQRVDLEFPVIGAPVTDANWKVYLPDGQSRIAVSGGFHESVTISDLLLVLYGQWLFEILSTGGTLLVKWLLILGLVVLVAWLFERLRRRAAEGATTDTPVAVSGWAASLGRTALRWTGTLIIPFMILGVLAGIAVPNFRAARERANTRACYANQKTIAGALEMYNLDKNTKVETLGRPTLHLLKSGGYLQQTPQDPGQGRDSDSNYQYTPGGNGILCTEHGRIQ